ncbi:unnamed protein product, partial [Prorocentrum cordatum]
DVLGGLKARQKLRGQHGEDCLRDFHFLFINLDKPPPIAPLGVIARWARETPPPR